METKININEIEPQAYKAMHALEGYLATTQLSKTHKELLKFVLHKSTAAHFTLTCTPKTH